MLAVTAAVAQTVTAGIPILPADCTETTAVGLPAGNYDFYLSPIAPGSSWKVVLTPFGDSDAGNPNLFVKSATVGVPFDGSAGPAFDFASTAGGTAVDMVVIPAPATSADIRIGVVGVSGTSSYSIKTCPISDSDEDGVTDDKDLCPGSTRGSRDHVDVNGCEHDQVDFDLDGWCNPGMPRIGKQPFSTRDDWCIGVDNCKLVKNAGQEQNYPADAGNDGDGVGDACNTGERQRRRPCVVRASS
jgi:hypothetical protein